MQSSQSHKNTGGFRFLVYFVLHNKNSATATVAYALGMIHYAGTHLLFSSRGSPCAAGCCREARRWSRWGCWEWVPWHCGRQPTEGHRGLGQVSKVFRRILKPTCRDKAQWWNRKRERIQHGDWRKHVKDASSAAMPWLSCWGWWQCGGRGLL